MKLKRLIGNRDFYKMVLLVAVPIMIQNGITNFVSLLDNIMVGRVGTEQMSGVAIVNQLIFVFNISIFGGISGPGIFGAQYFGCGDHKGLRNTLRLKLVIAFIVCVIGLGILLGFGDQLIKLYLHEGGDAGDVTRTLAYGKQYLWVILLEIVPFAIVQCYASTLRETGETMLPMKAGLAAVAVNLIGNYLLIFGKFGFPQLGVQGAAIATVLSRFVECAIVMAWTHRHKEQNPFIVGLYHRFSIPGRLVKQVLQKGSPLMINEIFWATGMAMLTQCYSMRGLVVIAGLNISSTIVNVFNVVFISMGNAISIIIGQLLGAGKMEEARDTDYKLIAFSIFSCLVMGGLMALVSPLFPQLYETSDSVRTLATQFICISALCMPLQAFMHAAYFTLRAGGKTFITFVFDSGFIWVVSLPLAFVLSRFTQVPIAPLYLTCQLVEIIKCVIGYTLVKKGIWLQNIVAGEA